jgi:hypothetical protein
MGVTANRIQFAFGVLGSALAWASMAMSSTSPGGENITQEEIVDLVIQILRPLGVTVDPGAFKASISDLT